MIEPGPLIDFVPSIRFLEVSLVVALSLLAAITGYSGFLSGKCARLTNGYWFFKEDGCIVAAALAPCGLFISQWAAVLLAVVFLIGKLIGWRLTASRLMAFDH